jgi:hypothetical protein
MSKLILKSFLLLLSTLLFTACVPKHNGKYHTKYSYHPYNKLYPNQITKQHHPKEKPPIQVAKVQKQETIIYPFNPQVQSYKGENPFKSLEQQKRQQRASFNESDFYPSNIPAQR